MKRGAWQQQKRQTGKQGVQKQRQTRKKDSKKRQTGKRDSKNRGRHGSRDNKNRGRQGRGTAKVEADRGAGTAKTEADRAAGTAKTEADRGNKNRDRDYNEFLCFIFTKIQNFTKRTITVLKKLFFLKLCPSFLIVVNELCQKLLSRVLTIFILL
jgi:hypothetical protein